jgi:serine/threonine-protein kinase
LLDAGITTGGQPYLVLELIRGERIDGWCDARALGIRERIALFGQVLDAVAAAHSQFVIHRDLKPSNILIDDSGRVKLLDFGIAQLVGNEAAPGLTREGALAFTPEYAAPEQFNGGTMTMATDVYGLGIDLFELLTGVHPSGLMQGSALEYMRCAAEGSFKPASERSGVHRKTLRGDLDNILRKALQSKSKDRYGSVPGFADDLRRHLSYEPVSARPDSLTYRFGRFVQRHKVGVAGTTCSQIGRRSHPEWVNSFERWR